MTKLIGGCLLVGMVSVLLVSVLFVSLLVGIVGSLASLGAGSGPPCATTPTPVPKHGGATSRYQTAATAPAGCVPPNQIAAAVVALARQMANALDVNPACSGIISYPNCYDTWYDRQFPSAVIAYGNAVCPGCAAWANGTYQCVSFVRGAYGPVYPMIWTANAFDLYALYAGKPGWQEIPSAAAKPAQRGIPEPGDVMVFKDSSVGHVAIVMNVVLPQHGTNGSITFANANSVSPYTTMPLLPDLGVDSSAWPGYTVWGYIRPAASKASLTLTI